MHSMTFWWGDKIEDLVIKGVHAEDTAGLVLLCLSLIGLCILYEAIKFQQARIRLITLRDRYKMIACQPPNESATLLTAAELSQQRIHMVQQSAATASTSTTPPPPPRVIFHDPAPRQRLLQLAKEAMIFLAQAILGYFLMLAVMSYNGPIFLAVVFGMALGYFLFGHFTMGLNMEGQQLRHTTFKCSSNCPNGESMPPAFASTTTTVPFSPSGVTSTSLAVDENQNMASTLALKKLQSVAEGIVDQTVTRSTLHTNHYQQQSTGQPQNISQGSCCSA